MSTRILLIILPNPIQELLRPSLLKHAHQGRPQRLTRIRGHTRNGSLGTTALLNIAACNLSEVEVSRDVCGDEDIGELAVGHEELGDEIDVPVVRSAVFLPWLLAFLDVCESAEELEM